MLKIGKFIAAIFPLLFVAFMLVLTMRGLPGNPTSADLNKLVWKENGPFELSPERGRFALLYSVVEDHSLSYSVDVARFTSPDVGWIHNKYVSIFAPTVSFMGIPGYVIGKYFGLSQFGTFLWFGLFVVLNVALIRAIAIRLGANSLAATIASLAFAFASPAFPYAVTLYEHHVSTTIILFAFYLLLRFNSFWSLATIWFLYALSFTVDYPNIFLMLPIAVAAFFRNGTISQLGKKFSINVSLPKLFSIIAIILPALVFLWFNKTYYGNPFQLSGTVTRVLDVKSNGKPLLYAEIYKNKKPEVVHPEIQPKDSLFTQFKPRNMINGFYILLFSPDRGTITFAPVMLLGLIGLVQAYRRKLQMVSVAIGIIGLDLLLYSMWGDPYGGWAFGARYMIPAYAVLAIYIALALTYLRKYWLFSLLFFVLFGYSAAVNTLGAVTSNSNPPKIEADHLSAQSHKYVDYTYKRNYTMLEQGISKSYFYQFIALRYITAMQFYWTMVAVIVGITGALTWMYKFGKGGVHEA